MVGPAQEHSDHSEQMAALYALELLEAGSTNLEPPERGITRVGAAA
jgi:hypothetical protein